MRIRERFYGSVWVQLGGSSSQVLVDDLGLYQGESRQTPARRGLRSQNKMYEKTRTEGKRVPTRYKRTTILDAFFIRRLKPEKGL